MRPVESVFKDTNNCITVNTLIYHTGFNRFIPDPNVSQLTVVVLKLLTSASFQNNHSNRESGHPCLVPRQRTQNCITLLSLDKHTFCQIQHF